MTADRRNLHRLISSDLARRCDDELAELVATGTAGNVGVGGGSTVLDVDGVKVFAKSVPLTDRELANPESTANLFDLPVWCQYGTGGPGFNAWRELAANIIVTDGVLSGATQAFPMLYHWRVLPGRPPIAAEHTDIDLVVAAHDGSSAVRTRLEALATASSSLVLFGEYIRHPMRDWLRENPTGKAAAVARQLSEIVRFLADRELLHMDGHFENMRSDGERIYLSDFGLATSPRFELSPAERAFASQHATHDADYAAMRLVNWLVTSVCGVPTSDGPVALLEYVRRCAAGQIPDDVSPPVHAIVREQAPAAARMNTFYWKLFGGDIHAKYPAA